MRCKADPFLWLADRSRVAGDSRIEMAAMLRGPDGEIVWGVWDFVDWSAAVLVLLEYHKSQIQRCLPTATGQDSERVHMPACKCIEWEKGADASYMHPAASKIRKFMHNSLRPWALRDSTGSTNESIPLLRCPLLLHLFFFSSRPCETGHDSPLSDPTSAPAMNP
jgi:hypothetical protein